MQMIIFLGLSFCHVKYLQLWDPLYRELKNIETKYYKVFLINIEKDLSQMLPACA